ncbi:MAG: type III-B CRISPR module-associated protein Cmr3 [Elusimicrobia bacterium]|nr:type III-B CRISPR module-associated protein Cmr3 [Elusimicrobiota bacterium]
MKQIKIEPIDPLLFRDGKPFQHNASSVFPPAPSVFAGFIRSKILLDACSDGDLENAWESVKTEIGYKNEDYGKFRLKGVFISKSGNDISNYYVPAPLDLYKEKRGKNEETIMIISPENKPEFDFNANLPQGIKELPFSPKELKFPEQKKGFIALKALFEKYLIGEKPSTKNMKSEEEFVVIESRVGLAMDNVKNAAEKGKLYTAEFLRFKKDYGFSLLFDGINWQQKEGVYFLGGEKRHVRFWLDDFNLDNHLISAVSEKIKNRKKFKIVLLSPSYIGSLDILGDRVKKLFLDHGIKAELVSAAVKTENIGGFDFAKFEPKPMKKAFSAGSVFYYELKSGKAEDLVKLNFSAISDEEWQMGMGISVIGGW